VLPVILLVAIAVHSRLDRLVDPGLCPAWGVRLGESVLVWTAGVFVHLSRAHLN